jgi:hypothetical protein
MAAQVALSLVLLIGAGLFVRTLQNLRNLDPSFRKEGVVLLSLDGRREGYHGSEGTPQESARLRALARGW